MKIKNEADYHLLTDAVEKGDNTRLELLLSFGANPNVINGIALFDKLCETSSYKMTPLQRACNIGDIGLVQTLILHGADVNYAPDNAFFSPLIRAIRSKNNDGKIEIVRLLVDCGADVNYSCNYGTVLSWLVSDTFLQNEDINLEIFDFLIQRGAIPESDDAHWISHVCYFKLEKFIRYLIENCGYSASGGRFISNYCKGTGEYSKDTFDYFLNHGADIYEKDVNGKNALDYLTENGEEEWIDYLTEQTEKLIMIK